MSSKITKVDKIYHRQPYDTAKSWAAFQAFLGIEDGRSLDKLHKRFTSQSPDDEPPTKSLPSLKSWCTNHHWMERAQAYDEDQSNAIQAEIALRKRRQAVKQVEDFIEFNTHSGRVGAALCLTMKDRLQQFMEPKTIDQERERLEADRGDGRDINGIPIIRNWIDAGRVSRIVAAIEMSSVEQWSRAAGVASIMSQHEATRER